ncbi:MAG: hypothetical protein AAF810_05340 [Cyanobacteria bacterium P01_D01_bin.36]
MHPSEKLETEGAWYIDLICEYLTLVSMTTLKAIADEEKVQWLLQPYGIQYKDIPDRLKIVKQLLVNISPRCSKSTIVTVCWPCWEWLFVPWMPYMCLSYDQGLASDHSDDRRKIIRSEWYQALSGGMKLSNSKNRITEFQNDSQGEMKGRGLNSGVTGGGGIRLIFDDANDPNKVESEPTRRKNLKSFIDYKVTRRNNPKLASVVNIQQRTHELDVSGWVFENEPDDWHCIVIQMEAETEKEHYLPLSQKIIKVLPGQLMHPERFGPNIIKALKRDPSIWAGRYQQTPNPSGGGMFKIGNWRLYNPNKMSSLTRTILSVDAAFKGNADSDFVVVGTVGQQYGIRQVEGIPEVDRITGKTRPNLVTESRYFIKSRWRKQADITATENAIAYMAAQHPEALTKLIEDKANGPAIISRLSSVIKGLEPYKPGADSKIARAAAVQPIQERGDYCVPLANWAIPVVESMGLDSITVDEWWAIYEPSQRTNAEHVPCVEWAKELIDEAAKFPSGANDDQVDMFVQAANWMEMNNPVQHRFGSSKARMLR